MQRKRPGEGAARIVQGGNKQMKKMGNTGVEDARAATEVLAAAHLLTFSYFMLLGFVSVGVHIHSSYLVKNL